MWLLSATGLEAKMAFLHNSIVKLSANQVLLLVAAAACKYPMEGVGNQDYPRGFAEWSKSNFMPAPKCHRHGQFQHVKLCNMHNISNNKLKIMQAWGCVEMLSSSQRRPMIQNALFKFCALSSAAKSFFA